MRDWLFRCPLTDPEEARQWRFLNGLLLAFMLTIAVITVPYQLLSPTEALVVMPVSGLTLAGLYAINHQGAGRSAAVGVLLFLFLILTAILVWSNTNLISAVIISAMFVLPITLTGVLLSWRLVPLVTGLSLLLVAWLYTNGSPTLIDYNAAHPTYLYGTIVGISVLLGMSGVLATLSSRQISLSFALLRERNRALDSANQDLQARSEREHLLGADIQELSGELRAVTIRQVQGTNVQAYSISQVVSSVSELHQTADQIAQLAIQVRQAAAEALANVERSQALVLQSRVAIERNQAQVGEVISHMTTLNRVTTRITTFTEAIRDLADETHLLALNATIEAAGAGILGRRFGVVANEVQNLAGRSTALVNEIQALIGELYAAGRQTLIATQHSDVVAREVVALADQVRGVQGAVLETVHSTNALVNQISIATGQQTSATQHVTTIMQQLAQVADGTNHDTATLQQAISDLGRAAERLTRVV